MSATIQVKIGLSDAEKAKIGTDIETKYTQRLTNCEEALGLGTRHILGIKFYGNAPTGVRTHEATTIVTTNVGLSTGDKVRNDCDSMWPWNLIKRVAFLARDSSGNGLKDSSGNYIYNQFDRIPMFWFKAEAGTDSTGSYIEYLITNKPMDGYTPIHRNDDGSIPEWFFMSAYWLTYLGDRSVALYGCQRGQEPRVDFTPISFDSNMSYVKEPEYGIVNNTRLHSGEPLNFVFARALLYWIEFGSRDTQGKMLGIIYDSYQWLDTSTNKSHNTIGTATNKIALPTSSAPVAYSSVGSKISICLRQGYWFPATITAMEANKDVNGDASGYTLLTLDVSFTLSADNYECATLRCGSPVGSCDDMLSSSGSDTANDGRHHSSYRGMEDALGGNLWNILIRSYCKDTFDGTNSINYLIRYEPGETETDYTTYTNTNQTMSVTEGWCKTIGIYDNLIVTTEVGADSSHYYCDYYYCSKNTSTTPFYRQIMSGGNAAIGGNAGLLFFDCNTLWGYLYFGSRPSILL